jgi:hypothetical protein
MSAELNRRTFIGLASGAALGVTSAVMPVRAQSAITLTADVVAVEKGFQLSMTYVLGSLGTEPLFLQVADSRGADVFFTWDKITQPSGTEVEDIGPFNIPYGHTYLVSIVDATGVQDPSSPVVTVEVPSFPAAITE